MTQKGTLREVDDDKDDVMKHNLRFSAFNVVLLNEDKRN